MTRMVCYFGFTIVIVLLATLPSSAYGSNRDHEGNDEERFQNMFHGGGPSCPSFRCRRRGYDAVPSTKAITALESSGCKAMSSGMYMMRDIQDGNDNKEEPFEQCCHEWHACYQICGMPKKACDDAFKSCSQAICSTSTQEDCTTNANIHSLMTSISGCTTYDSQQAKGCDCIEKAKISSSRYDAVKSFYQKYAPNQMEKVRSLVSKADSSTKLAGLFQKLVKKYPASITKVEPPKDEAKEQLYESLRNKAPTMEEKKELDTDEEEDDDDDKDDDSNAQEEEDDDEDDERIEL